MLLNLWSFDNCLLRVFIVMAVSLNLKRTEFCMKHRFIHDGLESFVLQVVLNKQLRLGKMLLHCGVICMQNTHWLKEFEFFLADELPLQELFGVLS